MAIVSVVIPTFGRPQLLKRAVESVLAQTVTDIEVIVVVDGEDPPTMDMLRGISDPRLRSITHPTNLGPGRARDTGADAATGEWVAFLDDDDEWLPEKLEKQLAVAPPDKPAVVMTLSHVVRPSGRFVRPVLPYDGSQPIDEWLFDRTTWLKGGLNFLQSSSLMVPRSLFERQHFRDLRQHEDWEFVIRAVKEHGHALVTAAEPLTVHYWGEARPSASKSRTWQGSLEWADRMGPLLTPRAYSGFLLNGIGQYSADQAEYRALPALLRAAFSRGRPTAKQLFRFGLTWLLPAGLRRGLRMRLQGDKSRGASNDAT